MRVFHVRHCGAHRINDDDATTTLRNPLHQNAFRPTKPRTIVIRMIFMSNQKLQFCM